MIWVFNSMGPSHIFISSSFRIRWMLDQEHLQMIHERLHYNLKLGPEKALRIL